MADVEFDYELSKSNYLTLVNQIFDEDSTHSKSTISKTIKIVKGPVRTHLHKYYEVSVEFGRDALIEKKKSPTDEPVQVLTFEDIFDLFIKYHISNNHLGGKQHLLKLETQLNRGYNYPSVCLSLILQSCNVCKSKSLATAKEMLTKGTTRVSYVFVTVMVQKKKSKFPNFSHLLIYLDKETDFVLLRPLTQNSVMEISMEIFKIMMTFGPPQKLCLHGYYLELYKKVGITLRQVCSTLSFSIEYKSTNYDPSAYVVNKLHEWMTKNLSVSWEVGVSIVQKELNNTLIDGKVSPEQLFYGPNINGPHNNVVTSYIDPVKTIIKEKIMKKSKDTSGDGVIELSIPSPDNNPTLADADTVGSNIVMNESESEEQTSDDEDYQIEEEPLIVLGKKGKSVDTISDQSNLRRSKRLKKSNVDVGPVKRKVSQGEGNNKNDEKEDVIDDNFVNQSDDELDIAIDPLQ